MLASYAIYGAAILTFPTKRFTLGVNMRALVNFRPFQRAA
jgi:hypothetical protein